MSEHQIQWVLLDHDAPDGVDVGDVVSAEPGGLPTYRVLAISGQQAWLRDDRHAVEMGLPLSRLHWKARDLR
jgi:hypothetical protein